MDSSQRSEFDDVTRTRWSMVRGLATRQPAEARQALTELAVRYWYPVYAYVRRCGHAPEIAQDIARAFFDRIAIDAGDPDNIPRGRFRDWLLMRLNAFLAGDWRELAAGESRAGTPALPELEQRNRDEHAGGESPEQAFQRGFALDVLARAFKALQAEAGQTGHMDMYEALQPYLSREPLPGQYEEMARALSMRPLVLVLALKRLRQRFRELVREEMSDIIASPDDLVAEQQALFAALAKSA